MALILKLPPDGGFVIDRHCFYLRRRIGPVTALFEWGGGAQFLLQEGTWCRVAPGLRLSLTSDSPDDSLRLMIEQTQPPIIRAEAAVMAVDIGKPMGNA